AGDGAEEGDAQDIDQAMLRIAGLTAGVRQVAEVVQDRGRGGTGHARDSWMWIGDGPSSGHQVAASSVPEIPLAPPGQITQHSAMAPRVQPDFATPMTGMFRWSRFTSACSAGKIILYARSPVAPKKTRASDWGLLMEALRS